LEKIEIDTTPEMVEKVYSKLKKIFLYTEKQPIGL